MPQSSIHNVAIPVSFFFVLQLATEEPAVGNRTARNRKPDSPQLKKRSFTSFRTVFYTVYKRKKTV